MHTSATKRNPYRSNHSSESGQPCPIHITNLRKLYMCFSLRNWTIEKKGYNIGGCHLSRVAIMATFSERCAKCSWVWFVLKSFKLMKYLWKKLKQNPKHLRSRVLKKYTFKVWKGFWKSAQCQLWMLFLWKKFSWILNTLSINGLDIGYCGQMAIKDSKICQTRYTQIQITYYVEMVCYLFKMKWGFIVIPLSTAEIIINLFSKLSIICDVYDWLCLLLFFLTCVEKLVFNISLHILQCISKLQELFASMKWIQWTRYLEQSFH